MFVQASAIHTVMEVGSTVVVRPCPMLSWMEWWFDPILSCRTMVPSWERGWCHGGSRAHQWRGSAWSSGLGKAEITGLLARASLRWVREWLISGNSEKWLVSGSVWGLKAWPWTRQRIACGRLSLVLGEQVGFSRYLVPLIVVPDRFSLYLVLLVRLHSVPFFLLFYFFYREKTKIILKLDSILLHPQHQWIGPPLSLPKLCAPFKWEIGL